MPKKTCKAGLIGSGFAASFHYEALKRVYATDVEIGGVYSQTAEHRTRFAEARNIRCFENLDEIIEACDVLHVCTPVVTHAPIAIQVLKQDKYPIVEKPLTGFCGDGSPEFSGETFSKQAALDEVLATLDRILEAEQKSQACILYAENWVYAPSIQKEREIIEKAGAQILWMHGEEAHSGSHAETYGFWKYSGGGVMLGKGCHPLTAALYLKRKEGMAKGSGPIHPATISARIHTITRLEEFEDKGHIRSNYHDIDDFSIMHITFTDGTVADIFASDIVLGGIHNWLEVAANNHRTTCNINPNTLMQTYNAKEEYFQDIYVTEKIGTKQGWSNPAPNEDWMTGYPDEIEAFYRTVAYHEPLESDSSLAADAISTIFSGYVSAEKGGTEVRIKNY